MIKIQDVVPQVYSSASRDFQYLSRLFDIVLNAVKTGTDLVSNIPNRLQADSKLVELLALTLGFRLKRNYDREQLLALVNVFPKILKTKGTLQAVEIAGEALVRASGASGFFYCHMDPQTHTLQIVIPPQVEDATLFFDLLPYIIPAGIACDITRGTVVTERLVTTVEAKVDSIELLGAEPILELANKDTNNDGIEEYYINNPGLGTLLTPEFFGELINEQGNAKNEVLEKYLTDGTIISTDNSNNLTPNAFIQSNMVIPKLTVKPDDPQQPAQAAEIQSE